VSTQVCPLSDVGDMPPVLGKCCSDSDSFADSDDNFSDDDEIATVPAGDKAAQLIDMAAHLQGSKSTDTRNLLSEGALLKLPGRLKSSLYLDRDRPRAMTPPSFSSPLVAEFLRARWSRLLKAH